MKVTLSVFPTFPPQRKIDDCIIVPLPKIASSIVTDTTELHNYRITTFKSGVPQSMFVFEFLFHIY